MKIGYARVSTTDQSVDAQVSALEAAGCDRIFTETASGARSDRPVLADAIDYLRSGDCLVAYKLDRVARSLPDLISTMDRLKTSDIGHRLSESHRRYQHLDARWEATLPHHGGHRRIRT